jgi:hypothetical protein
VQARLAVDGQKASQQSAAMAALAGSIAAGYARRDKSPLIGGPTMLSRPTKTPVIYGVPADPVRPGLAPPWGGSAEARFAGLAPATDAASDASRVIRGASAETGYECRPIGALYSPIRKAEARLAALQIVPRDGSSLGSVGAAVSRVADGADCISARPAEAMDSDELTAEIEAIEVEIRRISQRRAVA